MKHMLFARAASLLLALALLVSLTMPASATEGEEQNPEGGATLPGITISLSQSAFSLEIGDTETLTATVTGADPAPTVTWSSDDNEIAVVTSSGNNTATVRAVAAGEATITAKVEGDGDVSATCAVTVSQEDFILSDSSIRLDVNKTEQLTATTSGGSVQVSWQSSDTSVATVSDTGLVTAVATGEAMIYAQAGSYVHSCQVTVPGIVLEDLDLRVGDSQQIPYQVYGLDSPVISWTSNAPEVVRVSGGRCYAAAEGSATITASVSGAYSNTCTVTVRSNTAAVIPASASVGSPLDFSSLTSALRSRCSTVLEGLPLQYVSGLSVSTSEGTLYYQYRSDSNTGAGIAPSQTFYVSPSSSQRALSEVYFVPKAGFSGTATITYTGYASSLSFFQGTIQVSVEQPDEISYASAAGEAVQFRAADFNNDCLSRTGSNLRYVVFSLPDSSRGTLYRDYISPDSPGVELRSTDRLLLSGSPSVSEVYFVPAAGYSGTMTLSYTASNVSGDTYRGQVVLRVQASGGSGDVNYTVFQNGTVTFDDTDFNDLCRDLMGYALERVRFDELPSSSRGRLYYGYTSDGNRGEAVTTSRSYYRSSSPYLDRVTFVPAENAVGTVEIPFSGWDTRGNRFSGQVEITIRASGDGEIRYTVSQDETVTFDDGDFNDLCREETGTALRRVQFNGLPSSNRGTLYYNYSSSGSQREAVTASRDYYRTASPYLDRVTFVPSGTFFGTVEIPFQGWSTDGDSFSGAVVITVKEAPAAEIVYSTGYTPVVLRPADFSNACREMGLSSVSTVSLTPPGSAAGHLYSQYSGPLQHGSDVRSSTAYRITGAPSLGDVTFVPKAGYHGTVVIPFTATASNGRTCSGNVRISVQPPTYSRYFNDMAGAGWAAASADYLYENHIAGGYGNGQYGPANSITRGAFITMLMRAFGFTNNGASTFTDVPSGSYYAAAVAAAQQNGIADGYGDGTFRPGGTLNRQDAMTFLLRTLQAAGWSIYGGNEDTLAAYPDGRQVSAHARSAVSAMIERGILGGTSDGRLNPRGILTRAQMAVILHRVLTM